VSDLQRNLFGNDPDLTPTVFAQRHSRTSVEAGEKIKPVLNFLERKVLEFFQAKGDAGATDEEAQEGTGLGGSTERPRRTSLVEHGLLRDSGRTRRTRSGRQAVVWIYIAQEE